MTNRCPSYTHRGKIGRPRSAKLQSLGEMDRGGMALGDGVMAFRNAVAVLLFVVGKAVVRVGAGK